MNSRVDQISRYRGAPGVHIDFVTLEKSTEFKTGVPVFVGFGQLADDSASKYSQQGFWCRVTSWQQFNRSVEKMCPSGYLQDAVRGFFENGGESCVIVPVPWVEGSNDSVEADKSCIDALIRPFTDDMINQNDANNSTGSRCILEDIEDIDLMCVPDLMMMDNLKSKAYIMEAQRQILQHCKKMGDRFAILDMPLQALHIDQEKDSRNSFIDTEVVGRVIEHRYQISGSEGAIYFPWICVHGNNGELKSIPPCGHVAGIYARSDAKEGVFKAPANETVEGAFDLSISLTINQHTELNNAGVNCFRSFPNRGIRVWGAKTLSAFQQDQYISIRRLFLTLVRWIKVNTRDLIFETNDATLRDRIKFRLEGYCYQLYEKGALMGKSPEEAYYVKCDRELNDPSARESGKVISEIALAPIAPAEFIIIRIIQSAEGIVASELSLN